MFVSVVLGLATLTTAAPKGCAHKVKESIPPPRGWVQRRPAPPNLTIDLRIALPQPNFHLLEKELYEVRSVERTSGSCLSNILSPCMI